jgi:hypothetical protein
VQRTRIARAVTPRPRRLGQLAVHADARPVGVDPSAQPRPRRQQRLVADLDRVGVGGDQARAHVLVEHELGVFGTVGAEQLRPGGAPAGVCDALADVHQPQEHPSCSLPLGLAQPDVHRLGGSRHGAVDAAGRPIVLDAHPTFVAVLPRRQQRMRQQRQGAGVVRGPRAGRRGRQIPDEQLD